MKVYKALRRFYNKYRVNMSGCVFVLLKPHCKSFCWSDLLEIDCTYMYVFMDIHIHMVVVVVMGIHCSCIRNTCVAFVAQLCLYWPLLVIPSCSSFFMEFQQILLSCAKG